MESTGKGASPKKVFVRTWGCQMNEHDSERMIGILQERGYVLCGTPEEADLILLNTCSIREKSEHKVYSELGRYAELKKENPDLIVGVAGCVAQQEGNHIAEKSPWVSMVFGSKHIQDLPSMMERVVPPAGRAGEHKTVVMTEDLSGFAPTLPARRKDQIRAWVIIMEGCENFCSFCVVPYTRGRERSRPLREIVAEVTALARGGYKEVTLLGQNVNSYGRTSDEGVDFPDLLYRIHAIEGIERIRFMTSHPNALTPKMIQAMTDLPKVCEHLHLPLQSGSDRVLERMSREYTYGEYARRVEALRKVTPDISLTTDLIVGFPGETEEDFSKTLRAVEEIQYDNTYIFAYSRRPNTPALALDGHLPEEIKAERLQRLLATQKEISTRRNRVYCGKEVELLVEGKSKTHRERLTGRTRSNLVVNFDGSENLVGRLVTVQIVQTKASSLEGRLV
jgi:tRNA-2-methylthio-N6-dimethylallyladenosine synthase